MLDQIIMSCTVGFYIGKELRHNIKLMIARKDHGLLARFVTVLVLTHFNLQVHVFVEDLKQTVFCKYFFPQVCRLITVRILRIAFTTDITATV